MPSPFVLCASRKNVFSVAGIDIDASGVAAWAHGIVAVAEFDVGATSPTTTLLSPLPAWR